jgi:hypothetical protein
MRNVMLACLVGVALIAGLSCGETGNALRDDGIGPKIAGTWLGSYEFGETEKQRASFITTYLPDGTAFTTSARAWGAGDPQRHGLSSMHHIHWVAAGAQSIRWRLLHFGHNVDGTLRYLSRTHGTVEFDESFEQGRMTFQVEVFEPGDLLDPLDPNNSVAVPFYTASGASEIQRLRVGYP